MKYILNETPIKTTNNFRINNITVDLDIKENDFNDYSFSTTKDLDIKTEIKSDFNSKIGLERDKYLYIDITPKEKIDDLLIINYTFDSNNYLTSNNNINLDYDLNTIICFRGTGFLNFKLTVNSKENISSNISVVNLTSDQSTSLIAIENSVNTNSNIITNYIDLRGKLRISNYYSELNKESASSSFNTIYIGNKDERLDMNYYTKNNNKYTVSNMLFQGALLDNSYKSLKGTIDFIEGSSKSKGEENENCILLSENSKSRSLPMLLCHEEDVMGAHGMSSGKIDSQKLFYLMSKGISEEEAKRLIIKANFKIVLDNILDENIKNEIEEIIDERIK